VQGVFLGFVPPNLENMAVIAARQSERQPSCRELRQRSMSGEAI
jgi:hypothetical protein